MCQGTDGRYDRGDSHENRPRPTFSLVDNPPEATTERRRRPSLIWRHALTSVTALGFPPLSFAPESNDEVQERRAFEGTGSCRCYPSHMLEERTDAGTASTASGDAAKLRFARCRAAWPQFDLAYDEFERHVALHVGSEGHLAEAHAEDLYLACACASGNDGALAAFERTFAVDMERAVASIHSSRAFVEETLQVLRERLFVSKNGRPGRIADYAGRASLKTWLIAVTVRSAISLRRRKGEQPHQAFVHGDDRRLVERGPEQEFLLRQYKGAFEDAVRVALTRLPAKQRMLLRLNLVDGMSIDKLGIAYRVGRATAARWLASARRELLEQARAELCTKLGIASAELDSLAADIRSRIDVSVLRLLADTRPGT
jgi:RNA polymerase sigma-70 factor (ECF subfamily)